MKKVAFILLVMIISSCSIEDNNQENLSIEKHSIFINDELYYYEFTMNSNDSSDVEILESLDGEFISNFFEKNNNAALYVGEGGVFKYYTDYDKMLEAIGGEFKDSIEGGVDNNLTKQQAPEIDNGYLTLFEHEDYQGESIGFSVGFSGTEITNLNDYNFADITSSFVFNGLVYPNYQSNQYLITFYDDRNFEERSTTFDTHDRQPWNYYEENDLRDLRWGWPFTRNWNDRVTSIRIRRRSN